MDGTLTSQRGTPIPSTITSGTPTKPTGRINDTIWQKLRIMLSKKIQLFAAVDSFNFTDGSRDFGFVTTLFLNSDGLIAGVGSKPAQKDHCFTEVRIFEGSEISPDLLAAAIHYGLQQFSGRLGTLPSHLDVHVAQNLASHLRGFEKPIFERAGRDACASTVSVSRVAARNNTIQSAIKSCVATGNDASS